MSTSPQGFVQDPARNLLTIAQERRLARLEEEEPRAKVVGYRRPRNDDGEDLGGVVPIVRRPGGRRQAVLPTGRLSPVGAKRKRERS